MGGKKKQEPLPQQTDIYNRALDIYNQSRQPSALENEMSGVSQDYQNAATQARNTQVADYGNIMSGYKNFMGGLGGPTNFSFREVSAKRPNELGEAYGFLREAAPGYREFASTGGYSPTDIQELRARSVNPVRSAYGNTMMQLDRSRALAGAQGAPNYIAATSRAQRELPGQIADAMTGINAELANSIRQGKLAGLAGLSGIGSEMGGLSSAEAQRILSADLANQGADLQTQAMREQSLQNLRQSQLAGLAGQTSLYGTTPAMAATFGNQALNAYGQRANMEQFRQGMGLDALGLQSNTLTAQDQMKKKTPWWKTALSVAATVAPYVAMAASSRELKEDIEEVKDTSKFAKYLKDIPLYTWKYKGDKTTHFGPIAEEFKEKFGIGDGKTLHLADVMGVTLAAAKEMAVNHA